jgi:pyruvate/2-oxoglutarate dehydrogenase complex dihydrolipoamide dehydrogenase (E3) component
MAETERYTNVVLGSGEAGKYIAWTLARQGERTAVVERRWIGGSCPNIACLPSKKIIHSAEVAALGRRADEFGIESRPVVVSMQRVRDRKRAMLSGQEQVS